MSVSDERTVGFICRRGCSIGDSAGGLAAAAGFEAKMPGPCAVPGGGTQISPDVPSRKVTSCTLEPASSLQHSGPCHGIVRREHENARPETLRGRRRNSGHGSQRSRQCNQRHKPKTGEHHEDLHPRDAAFGHCFRRCCQRRPDGRRHQRPHRDHGFGQLKRILNSRKGLGAGVHAAPPGSLETSDR